MGVDGGRPQIARQGRLRDLRQIVQAGGFLEERPPEGEARPGADPFHGPSPAELRRRSDTAVASAPHSGLPLSRSSPALLCRDGGAAAEGMTGKDAVQRKRACRVSADQPLRKAFFDAVGRPAVAPLRVSAHCWRDARAANPLEEECLWDPEKKNRRLRRLVLPLPDRRRFFERCGIGRQDPRRCGDVAVIVEEGRGLLPTLQCGAT